MSPFFSKIFLVVRRKYSEYINRNLFRNIILFSGGIILFIAGVIVYGILLNLQQEPLSNKMKKKGFAVIENPNIIIDRSNFTLSVYEDTVLIKTYSANFGRNSSKQKIEAGDNATPVGTYKICEIDSLNKYHKFFRINYPNMDDAEEALRRGLISQSEFDKLKFQFYYDDCITAETKLGGNIGIHGIGKYNSIFKYLPFVYNWTDGSIALSNEDIDELYLILKKGTKVVIR